jgi:hypothetical protein
LQRAYETSPIKSIVDMAKNEWDQNKAKSDQDVAVQQQVATLIKQKDWGRAAETLLSHIAKGLGNSVMESPGMEIVSGIAKSSYQHGKAAVNAARQGNTGEAIAQGAEAVPVLGQIAEQVGEPLGKDLKEGNYSGAVGDALGGASSIAPLLAGGEGAEAEQAAKPTVVRPAEIELAGENIPVRASSQPGIRGKIASAGEYGADTGDLKKFDVEKTQPAARKAVANIAADAGDTAKPAIVPPKEDAFGFGQAGDAVKARSQEVFQKLDDLSGREFSEAQEDAAGARQDYTAAGRKAYRDAMDKQNQIFDDYKDEFEPGALAKAKADWKQSQGMEDLRVRFNRAVHPTPVELTTQGQPDTGYVNGKTVRESITDALQKDTRGENEFERAGFTPQHVQTMEDIGRLLEKGSNLHKLNPIVKLLFSGAQGAAHPAGLLAVPGEYVASKVLGRVMTSPAGSGVLLKGLKSGASVAAIANALRIYASPNKQSQPQSTMATQ